MTRFVVVAAVAAMLFASVASAAMCGNANVPALSNGKTFDLASFKSTGVLLPLKATYGWDITVGLCHSSGVASCSATSMACQVWDGGQASLGSTAAVSVTAAGETYLVNATGGDNSRNLGITVSCEQGATDTVAYVKEEPTLKLYEFTWKTDKMCGGGEAPTPGNAPTPSAGPTPPPSPTPPTPPTPAVVVKVKATLSGGSIFLILCAILFVVYCVAGAAYMRVRHEAEGSEMIPNKEFWSELPGLIKDGGVFLVDKIRGIGGGGSYAEV